jgi:hypothetical protein
LGSVQKNNRSIIFDKIGATHHLSRKKNACLADLAAWLDVLMRIRNILNKILNKQILIAEN